MIQTGSKRSSQDRPDSAALAGAPAAAGDVPPGPATLPPQPPLAAHESCSAQAQAGMAECRTQQQAAAAGAVLLAGAQEGLPAWQPWMVQGRPGATLLRKVVRAGLSWKQRALRSSAHHQSNCCAVLCCGALRCALRATLHHAEGMTFTHGCLLMNHQLKQLWRFTLPAPLSHVPSLRSCSPDLQAYPCARTMDDHPHVASQALLSRGSPSLTGDVLRVRLKSWHTW
jgi:hypothetical protein